jgi:hypothetical protein
LHGAHEERRDVAAKFAWQSTQRGYRWRRWERRLTPVQTPKLADKECRGRRYSEIKRRSVPNSACRARK